VAIDTRTVVVKGTIGDIGFDSSLKDGQYAQVQLVLAEISDALVIPEAALIAQGERFYVYVKEDRENDAGQPQQTARLQAVTLGQRRHGQVQITQGLNPGDTVVTDGIQKLFDGALLKAEQPEDTP